METAVRKFDSFWNNPAVELIEVADTCFNKDGYFLSGSLSPLPPKKLVRFEKFGHRHIMLGTALGNVVVGSYAFDLHDGVCEVTAHNQDVLMRVFCRTRTFNTAEGLETILGEFTENGNVLIRSVAHRIADVLVAYERKVK